MTRKTKDRGGASETGRRRWWIVIAALSALVIAAGVGAYLATDSGSFPRRTASASPSTHQFLPPECAPLTGASWRYPGPARIESTRYELFAIGYSCSEAGTWARQLSRLSISPQRSGAQSPIKGPSGFNCAALPDANGHAYAGGCQKGKQAFGWNWNVANSRQALVRGEDGSYHVVTLSGSDAETIVRPLTKGRYQVYVLNTSGIGFVNGFTWSPPPGWTINAITKTSGGHCKLRSDGKVACNGKVAPPTCLCTSDGGAVTIDLAVSVHTPTGKHVTVGAVGAKLRITTMTPVPYLIPGTPKQAKRQGGV